MTKLEIK